MLPLKERATKTSNELLVTPPLLADASLKMMTPDRSSEILAFTTHELIYLFNPPLVKRKD